MQLGLQDPVFGDFDLQLLPRKMHHSHDPAGPGAGPNSKFLTLRIFLFDFENSSFQHIWVYKISWNQIIDRFASWTDGERQGLFISPMYNTGLDENL